MYSVYKITNLLNNKMYIGQTCRSPNERWYDHKCLKKSKHRNALRSAIAKYGKANFKVEVLKDKLTPTQANKIEIRFIKELNTLVPIGYNLTSGGKNFRHSKKTKIKIKKSMLHKMKKVVRLEDNKIYCSISEAARDIGTNKGNLIKHLKRVKYFNSVKSFTFRYVDNEVTNV